MPAENSIALTAGSDVVTGYLTQFVVADGDLLVANGYTAVTFAARSSSEIVLREPWAGPDIAETTNWEILPTGPYWSSSVTTNRLVTDLIQRLESGLPLRPDAAGPLIDRDQYNDMPEGFLYLQTDINPFLLFVKTGPGTTEWSSGQRLQADQGQATLEAMDAADRAEQSAMDAAASASAADADAVFADQRAADSNTAALASEASAGRAATSEANAASSASAAAASASAAQASETNAAGSASAAASEASNASASASLARQWAEAPDNTDVSGIGTRSARHHANASAGSASSAASSAAAALSSENNAAASAADSAASAKDAATSAASAAQSATDAQSHYNLFRNQYYGFRDADPTTRPDGSALVVGDLYTRTTEPRGLKVYDDIDGWVAAGVSPEVLAAKADKTYVDEQLALKANLSGADFAADISAPGVTVGGNGVSLGMGGKILDGGTDGAGGLGRTIIFANNDSFQVVNEANSAYLLRAHMADDAPWFKNDQLATQAWANGAFMPKTRYRVHGYISASQSPSATTTSTSSYAAKTGWLYINHGDIPSNAAIQWVCSVYYSIEVGTQGYGDLGGNFVMEIVDTPGTTAVSTGSSTQRLMTTSMTTNNIDRGLITLHGSLGANGYNHGGGITMRVAFNAVYGGNSVTIYTWYITGVVLVPA